MHTTTLDVPGARLYYELRGAGPLLLLVGAPMDARAFEGLAEALAGFEEHLRSQRDLSEHTVRGYVTDAVSLLDHLARRVVSVADRLGATLLSSDRVRQEIAGLDILTDGDCRFDDDVGGQSCARVARFVF